MLKLLYIALKIFGIIILISLVISVLKLVIMSVMTLILNYREKRNKS